jgi:hypothetical protein
MLLPVLFWSKDRCQIVKPSKYNLVFHVEQSTVYSCGAGFFFVCLFLFSPLFFLFKKLSNHLATNQKTFCDLGIEFSGKVCARALVQSPVMGKKNLLLLWQSAKKKKKKKK